MPVHYVLHPSHQLVIMKAMGPVTGLELESAFIRLVHEPNWHYRFRVMVSGTRMDSFVMTPGDQMSLRKTGKKYRSKLRGNFVYAGNGAGTPELTRALKEVCKGSFGRSNLSTTIDDEQALARLGVASQNRIAWHPNVPELIDRAAVHPGGGFRRLTDGVRRL